MRARRVPATHSLILLAILAGASSCTCQPNPSQVVIESSWSAGAVRGQIHNNSYCDVSSMAVNVRVIGRGNQAIHSGLHAISQPVPAGEMRDFKIDISVVGGRRAVVVIQDLN